MGFVFWLPKNTDTMQAHYIEFIICHSLVRHHFCNLFNSSLYSDNKLRNDNKICIKMVIKKLIKIIIEQV